MNTHFKIGKIVHFKAKLKLVLFQLIQDKLNGKSLEEYSSNNQVKNQNHLNKIKIFEKLRILKFLFINNFLINNFLLLIFL